VAKAEHIDGKENPRFVVTSLSSDQWEAQALYEQLYCNVLVSGLRRLGLKATELAGAQVSTIRTKLLKIGAQIRVTARKVWVSMASSYPWQDVYQQVWANLRC
jgi:hypothetical protein